MTELVCEVPAGAVSDQNRDTVATPPVTEAHCDDDDKELKLVFAVDGACFATDLGAIREVAGISGPITRIPNAQRCMRGLINLHNEVVPIFDLAVKLGKAPAALTERSRVIVFSIQDKLFGVLVSSVRGVVSGSDFPSLDVSALLEIERLLHNKTGMVRFAED